MNDILAMLPHVDVLAPECLRLRLKEILISSVDRLDNEDVDKSSYHLTK